MSALNSAALSAPDSRNVRTAVDASISSDVFCKLVDVHSLAALCAGIRLFRLFFL